MDNAVTPFSSTLNVPCKCCGARALVRHGSEGRGQIGAGGQPVSQRLQRTYHCTLCGDAWVSTVTQHANGTDGKWLHIPNWQPHLTRVIELDYHPDNILLEQEDENWDYYLGAEMISQSEWFHLLDERRKAMRSRLAN